MGSLCDITSRRSFLALLWSIVVGLSALGYIICLCITLQSRSYFNNYLNNQEEENDENDREDWEGNNLTVSIASRAMLFSYIWTAMSASALGVAGTIVLGVLSPRGQHYTCFPSKIIQTSPITIGAFVGSLIMFANLLFICAILFGQFNIRDYSFGNGDEEEKGGREMQWLNSYAIQKSSTAFSFLCLFLAIIYVGFAVILYSNQEQLMQEIKDDARVEALEPSPDSNHLTLHPSGHYVGGKMEKPNEFIRNNDIPSLA